MHRVLAPALAVALVGCHWVIGHAPPVERGDAARGREVGVVDRSVPADGPRAEEKITLDAPRDQWPADKQLPDKQLPDKQLPDKQPAPDKGNEICGNGNDDDGDGLYDCADPDCTSLGYECVLASAVVLQKHAPGFSGLPCMMGGKTYFYEKENAFSYQCLCSSCLKPPPCCALSPLSCGQSTCGEQSYPEPLTCALLPHSLCATGPAKTGACSCGPSTVVDIAGGWAFLVSTCSITGLTVGCTAGMICAAPPPSGAMRCEPSANCTKTTVKVFAAEDDQRACTCQCAPKCVGGGYTIHCADPSCSGTGTTFPPATACKSTGCVSTTGTKVTSVAPSASCVAIGSPVTGTLSGIFPETFCCPSSP